MSSSEWPTEKQHSSIFIRCFIIFKEVPYLIMSYHDFFNLVFYFNFYLIYIDFLSFCPASCLHIYYGFQLIFMKILSVQISESISCAFSWDLFLLFVCFILFQHVSLCFILLFFILYCPFEACLFSNER